MELEISDEDLSIRHPARVYICGPTSSGKTSLILGLLKHRKTMFDKVFSHIFYCLPESLSQDHHTFVEKLKNIDANINIVSGIPSFSSIGVLEGAKLIILDDMIFEIVKSPAIFEAFTISSSHSSISLIISSQNCFFHGKYRYVFITKYSLKVL